MGLLFFLLMLLTVGIFVACFIGLVMGTFKAAFAMGEERRSGFRDIRASIGAMVTMIALDVGVLWMAGLLRTRDITQWFESAVEMLPF